MYDNLKSLGVNHPDDIDRYSLRQEANNDILKIYFRRDKGEFSPKALNSNTPVNVRPWCRMMLRKAIGKSTNISSNLRHMIDELDQICLRDQTEVDLKHKILDDLRHLESVVANKIAEIEADLGN